MATYHPIFSGLWNDDALEGLAFEAKAFFAFLCSNDHVRPSGIYRVTDKQLAEETGLRVAKICRYLEALSVRRRIVRDGLWLFVCGYFKRQPKQERLLIGAHQDIENCSSVAILEAFALKYPHFSRWSKDRLETVGRPINVMPSPMQNRAEQSSTEQWTVSGRSPSEDDLAGPRERKEARPKYLEIVERMRADHPELSKADAESRALAEFQGRLKP